MKDDVGARVEHRAMNGVGVTQIRGANRDLAGEITESPAVRSRTDSAIGSCPRSEQVANEVRADEAAGACDQRPHPLRRASRHRFPSGTVAWTRPSRLSARRASAAVLTDWGIGSRCNR